MQELKGAVTTASSESQTKQPERRKHRRRLWSAILDAVWESKYHK